MSTLSVRKILTVTAAFLVFFLAVRYLWPLLMPFVLGWLIALGAEPAVRLGVKKLKLPRPLAAGLGVSVTLLLLITTLWLIGALAVKEMGQLAGALGNVQKTVQQGLALLEGWLLDLARRVPDGPGALLTRLVQELFGGGSSFFSRLAGKIPGLLGDLISRVPSGAIGLITGILAGFMISARLPQLKKQLSARLPEKWKDRCRPALSKLRRTLGAWLRAQLKMMAIIYGVLAVGLFASGISYGPVWALPVAIVDAVPVLGTGAVLIPWGIIAALQGNTLQAIGLFITYAAALVIRTVLEPRLVGKQIGLDPLVTLIFFYVGYKLFGVLGMLFAPVLAAATRSLTANMFDSHP